MLYHTLDNILGNITHGYIQTVTHPVLSVLTTESQFTILQYQYFQ